MNDLVPRRNCPGVQGKLIRMTGYYGHPKNYGPNTLGYVTFIQNKSTFARPKKMQTLVFIIPKVCTKQLYTLSPASGALTILIASVPGLCILFTFSNNVVAMFIGD